MPPPLGAPVDPNAQSSPASAAQPEPMQIGEARREEDEERREQERALVVRELLLQRAVELNLSLRNSAVSEFHPHGPRLRLGSWNALPHLHGQRELWTYY